jgi:hypothetical protein
MLAIDQSRARGHELRPEAGALEPNKIVSATVFADEACPVMFRDSSMRQILAFEHPVSGLQLLKGGINRGEDARSAALRELKDDAGIANTSIARDLGTWSAGDNGHVWSLQLCTYSPGLPETWMHRCEDGGHDLKFFWQDMHRVSQEWPELYQRALAAIHERARVLRWRG